MRSLNVWLAGERLGRLGYFQGELQFNYASDWLASADSKPLSQSLPLSDALYSGARVNAFFGGLLPEGQMRKRIAQQQGVSERNDFSLLDVLGGECAGAVSLLPEAIMPEQHGSVEWLTEEQLAEVVAELPARPMLAGKDGIRLSLAGAQDKLPVVFDGKRVGLPLNNEPSTHILKPPIAGLVGTVDNEAFCLALAARAGINVATAGILHNQGKPLLLVRRYDRVIDDDSHRIIRVHQEDFCQALGIPASQKYQPEGGPALDDCFDLVRRATKPAAPQLIRLLDYVIFNTLIGNHDAHGKNFSLLYGQATQLAPMYDVLSTAIHPELTRKMAMKVGSQYEFEGLMPRHWEAMAEGGGLNATRVLKRLHDFAAKLPALAKGLLGDSYASSPTAAKIVALIDERCAKTLRLLT